MVQFGGAVCKARLIIANNKCINEMICIPELDFALNELETTLKECVEKVKMTTLFPYLVCFTVYFNYKR